MPDARAGLGADDPYLGGGVGFCTAGIGFMVIPRLCGLSPWVGVVGIAAHMCIRGWWWSGGSYELIDWGLITNVLAAALVFTVLVLAAAYLEGRSPRLLGLAGLLVGWSIWTNPRSAIALLTIAAASIIVVTGEPVRSSVDPDVLLLRFRLRLESDCRFRSLLRWFDTTISTFSCITADTWMFGRGSIRLFRPCPVRVRFSPDRVGPGVCLRIPLPQSD